MIRIFYIENDVFKSVLMLAYFRVHIPILFVQILITINRLPMATETSLKTTLIQCFALNGFWLLAEYDIDSLI